MQGAVRVGHVRAPRAGWGRGHTLLHPAAQRRARPAGTVVVLGRAGRDGEAALARVVAAYAEGTARASPIAFHAPLNMFVRLKGTWVGRRLSKQVHRDILLRARG